jgi:putative salt-induced outer membrane protein YdiY
MKWLTLLVGILAFLSLPVFADQIVLKNGDRLSGTILKSDDKSLVMKTEFAGEVTVQWAAVEQLTSTQSLHLGLKDGKTVAGPVSTSADNEVVAASASGPVNVPKDTIVTIRNDAEEASYEKSLHPSFMTGWAGGANVGFALTRGNSKTKNIALAFTAARKTSNDQLSLYANSIYATNDAPGANLSTTANAVQGGLRYDRNFVSRLFGFGKIDFETDALQDLDLRSSLGGGLGLHVIQSAPTTLDLLMGINYTHESYSATQNAGTLTPAFTRSFPAATVGEILTHKWHASTTLTQRLYFYPDLSDRGEYRGTFDFGTVTRLSKWLGWQNAFGDIYVTNPPAGKKQNDILYTTGLNLSFSH